MKSSAHEAVLASHFKLLQSICQSANETLSDSINNFNSREFISVNLLTEKQLVEQTISAIEDFQNKTIHRFKIIFDFIIDIILGNQLMSIYGTNWYFIPDPNGSNAFYTKSKSYSKILIQIFLLLHLCLIQMIVRVEHHNHQLVLIHL